MTVIENKPLTALNTFGLAISAKLFVELSSVEGLQALIKEPWFTEVPRLVLGGGSNVLFVQDFPGLVMNVNLKGKTIVEEDEEEIQLAVGAGENWHELVMYCVERGWGGIENLSLIPGKMGAAPIQNIGAYGVELKDVFVSLEAVELETGTIRTFSHADCEFGYRDSVFKRDLKGKYLITQVTLRLQKNPAINTGYGAIKTELAKLKKSDFNIRDVSNVVIMIRRSKLPDPAEIGNAGSFFKNPEIPTTQFEELKKTWPDIVGYPVREGVTKVPAGWLIDRAGWKGKRFGDYGVHARQALVLVNYGGAAGADIYALSGEILADIQTKYGIQLEREVNVI